MNPSNIVVPVVICVIVAYGLIKEVDVFGCFLEGAREGLQTAVDILPALVALMTSVGMFKASGALDILTHAAAPLAQLLGLPQEVMPLAILRPISGSGGMVIYSDLLASFGPDSYIGRVASVMQGSSETTFYTIAVYYGATKITQTRHTLQASVTADVVGVVVSALLVRLVFSMAMG